MNTKRWTNHYEPTLPYFTHGMPFHRRVKFQPERLVHPPGTSASTTSWRDGQTLDHASCTPAGAWSSEEYQQHHRKTGRSTESWIRQSIAHKHSCCNELVPVGQRSPHHQRSTAELAPGANSPGQQKVYVSLFQRSSSPWPFFWEPHPHNLSGPSARASCNPQSRRPWPVLAGHTQNPRSDPPYAGSPQKSQYVKRCQKNAIGIQHETKLMT